MPTGSKSATATTARGAERAANEAAEKLAAESRPKVLPLSEVTPPTPTPGHRQKERPADAGFVWASPAQAEKAQNGIPGGTVTSRPIHPVAATVQYEAIPASKLKADAQKVEMVSNAGVPDLGAIRRHNAEMADSLELGESLEGAPGGLPAGQAPMVSSSEVADKSLVIEGHLPGAVDDEDGDKD